MTDYPGFGGVEFDSSPIRDLRVDDTWKGFPFGRHLRLDDIGRQGWNVLRGQVPFPVAVLKQSAIDWNSRSMAQYLLASGVLLAPHAKTTMAPQLMQRQLEDGAWALTVATAHQVRVCRAFGAKRLVLANQAVGRLEVDYLLTEMHADPSVDIYCLVDSEAGLEILEVGAARVGLTRRVPVLVEFGYGGGRTGKRDHESALQLMRRVRSSPALKLTGLETFEGLFQFWKPSEAYQAVESLLQSFSALLQQAVAEDLFDGVPPLISAGGSAFYPEVIEQLTKLAATVVIRSGCYITHDHGVYEHWHAQAREQRPDFGIRKPAFEVWGLVQSIPEPGLAIVTAGRRDFGCDSGLPKPIRRARDGQVTALTADWVTQALSDQHAHVRIPGQADLAVGDAIGFGISHPCTTFDKWNLIYLIDDDYNIIDAIKTYF